MTDTTEPVVLVLYNFLSSTASHALVVFNKKNFSSTGKPLCQEKFCNFFAAALYAPMNVKFDGYMGVTWTQRVGLVPVHHYRAVCYTPCGNVNIIPAPGQRIAPCFDIMLSQVS